MSTKPQHGYLVLADISGFTSYLAQVARTLNTQREIQLC